MLLRLVVVYAALFAAEATFEVGLIPIVVGYVIGGIHVHMARLGIGGEP